MQTFEKSPKFTLCSLPLVLSKSYYFVAHVSAQDKGIAKNIDPKLKYNSLAAKEFKDKVQAVAEGRLWTEHDRTTKATCVDSTLPAVREPFPKDFCHRNDYASARISQGRRPQTSPRREDVKYIGFGNRGVSPRQVEGSDVLLGHLSGGMNMLTQHFERVSLQAGRLVEDAVAEQLVDIEQLKERAASAAQASIGFGRRTWSGLRDVLQSTIERMGVPSEQDQHAASSEVTNELVEGNESYTSKEESARPHKSGAGSDTHDSSLNFNIKAQNLADGVHSSSSLKCVGQMSSESLSAVPKGAAPEAISGISSSGPYQWKTFEDDAWGDTEWGK